jgi:hypothetical protein
VRRDRWLRAIGYGLLAEIATIVTIVAIVLVYTYGVARGLPASDYAAVGAKVGAIVGIGGGAFYTFLFARSLMRHVSSRFVAHGIVVALAAVTLSIVGSIAGHQGVPAGYMVASALKIIAGAFAGFLATRRMRPQTV